MTAHEASNQRSLGRTLSEIIGIAIIYYLTGRLGRTVAPPPGIATVFWPPSGIALASLLILGNRVWPGIWLGAFLSNDWPAFDVSSVRSAASFLATGAGIDTGSLLQALFGAMLFRRFVGVRDPFERSKSTLTFVGIALVTGAIGSTFGVVSLCLGGALPWDAALDRWWTWWIGDTDGVLVVTPLCLVWWHLRWPDWDRGRWTEAFLLFIGATLFAVAIFVWWRPSSESGYPADLLILPLVAWVAYRFTQREVTLVALLVLSIALWGTIHGRGPYRGATPWSTLPVLAAFIGMLSILSITIGAVIAERKKAGEALRASEHWLRESQRISRIGSYVFDVRSGSWTSSEILDEIFGIDAKYPRTLDAWGALLHPEDRQGVLDYLKNDVIARGEVFHREYRIVRPSMGDIRWVLCRGELSLATRGSPAKMAGTILDITDRKGIEAQLLQSQKMESIGRLAGGVAHDFNNLLTVINGYGDMVLGRLPAHDPLYQQITQIREAGQRAADLTMQLLAFSRKQVLQPKILNLNDVVRGSESMLRRIIGEDIELACVLDPSLWRVEADYGQLHQVIVNLAVNARDAMPDGGKLLIETANVGEEIGADSQPGARAVQYVSLTVRDTGHGMDAATIECAFEPFFTTKGLGKGTGLGLATVYGIVRQSGGHISIQSELGLGATFTVLLPSIGEAAQVEASPEAVTANDPTRGETVLLVEDEDGVRRLVATILAQNGYRVLEAAGGDEAIRTVHAYHDRIDLLITDVVMPRMKGPELVAHLHAQYPEIKVLYISGYSDPSNGEQVALGAGSHYLQKPFGKDTLARAVRDALGPR